MSQNEQQSTTEVKPSEDTAIVVRSRSEALAANPQLAAQTSAIEVLKQRAAILLESGLLPDSITRWQVAAAIMMRAEELDVDYWTGLMHLNAIKGAPQPDGQLCMALILRSGLMERYEVVETTDQRCVIRMKRTGQPTFDVICTYDEYSKVAGPDGKRQPKTHLFWYTYKQGARRLFSDVLNNMQPKQTARNVIIEDDLPTDLPVDAVYVDEEGEDKSTASVPLSVTASAPPAPLVSSMSENASAASDEPETKTLPVFQQDSNGAEVLINADGEIIARGNAVEPSATALSLDLKSLQGRAIRAGVVDNEFHFAALLKQMLEDKTIKENMTADKILDLMRTHKAEKDFERLTRPMPGTEVQS